MSEQFKREDRYIVIKKSDIERLPITERFTLEDIKKTHDILRVSAGKKPLECLVIESDWPEYEFVWRMIEDRVAMEALMKSVVPVTPPVAPDDSQYKVEILEPRRPNPDLARRLLETANWAESVNDQIRNHTAELLREAAKEIGGAP